MGMDLTGLGSVFDFAGKVIDKIFPNPEDKARAQIELIKLQQSGELAQLAAETEITKAQLAVNQVEAANASLFVAGWRPWVGWTCGAAMGYVAIADPLMRFTATVGFGYTGEFPVIDTAITLQVLLGLLGLGGLRSMEKIKGASK